MLIESETHTGLIRSNNEDRFLVKTFGDDSALLALADGMGGHVAGEVAAQVAMEAMESLNPASNHPLKDLVRAVYDANRTITDASRLDQSLKGMGTTVTCVFISGGSGYWVHVGDSRLYHFRQGLLHQVTTDHTIPGSLLKKGKISSEMARVHPYGSMLLKCIGCPNFEPEEGTLNLESGDLLMLSSDGLHDSIPHSEIESVLAHKIGLREKLGLLLGKSLKAGGSDNITAIIAKI